MKSRQRITCAVATLMLLWAMGAGAADDYPSHAVTIVVPSTAGGGFDLVGRVMGEALGKQLGKSFIIDNRTGSARSSARSMPPLRHRTATPCSSAA